MKFFNIDLHVACQADIEHTLKFLGHSFDYWCMSAHHWILDKEKKSISFLDNDKWNGVIKDELWNVFYETYQNELDKYDAFVCCYPPAFSLLYRKFNKPIIIYAPIRYEVPFFNNAGEWNAFNGYLRNRIDSGKIIFVANSIYDQKYSEAFIGRPVRYIPSLCGYIQKHSPENVNGGFLLFARDVGRLSGIAAKPLNTGVKFSVRETVRNSSGVVHFPYNISTMSIFEHYTMGLPMFFPSERFLMELYEREWNVLRETAWIYGQPRKSIITPNCKYDPNDWRNIESVYYWLQYADYYNTEMMPYITYFDSLSDLNKLLKAANLKGISEKMTSKNEDRREFVYSEWRKVISLIS